MGAQAVSREVRPDGTVELRAAVSVSEDWTRFFSANRTSLSRVHVLVGSKAVGLTVAIAQHLSRTGDLRQIYSAPDVFEARLDLARARGAAR